MDRERGKKEVDCRYCWLNKQRYTEKKKKSSRRDIILPPNKKEKKKRKKGEVR